MSAWLDSPVIAQFFITAGTIGSAWLTNRVWKGKKARDAAAAAEPAPKPVVAADDPFTPMSLVARLDRQLTEASGELAKARDQRAIDIEEKARLSAEVLNLQEDKTWLQRRVLELEAREAARAS
jgi:hypothetical protein